MTYHEQRLAGRSAIVTGGGYGIGRAYAERLAAEGAQVVVADIDGDAADRVAKEIGASGGAAIGVTTDVAEEASVAAMVAATTEAHGKIDILVNNAAVFTKVPLIMATPEEMSVEEFERVLRVNVTGTWLCSRAVLPQMRALGYGKIINISSGTVFKGSGGASFLHYVTSKAAILGLTRALARSVGADGIRVNCVAPGATQTEDFDSPDESERFLARARAERALVKVETPEDLVGIVAFLASSDSDFITGQTIVVDGGSFMH